MKSRIQDSWVFAIEEKNLKTENLILVSPKGLPILLIEKNGSLYAFENKCAHMACPLSGGVLDGYILQCPCHDWKFDIRTGEFLDAKEIKIITFGVKKAEGKIFINLSGGK